MSKKLTDRIQDIDNPEIFLALNKICKYLTKSAWKTSALGSGEVEAEFDLAILRTKRHEKEIKILANIDYDLAWGQFKRKTKDGTWITTGDHNINPWYEGNLNLTELLGSMDDLVEILSYEDPKYLPETEFLHFYWFLRSKLPHDYPKPESISLDSLHPKIKEHCLKLYRDKHYSDAILTAYKIVFNEIKHITNINNLDGKRLIEKAFSLNQPIIKLNELESQSDRDEQLGFMFLYTGATVGIRNPKAHDLVVQDDKMKTLAYLSFASLLLDRLDNRISPVN